MERPLLILSKDNSPFAGEKIIAGRDWGVDQVNEILRGTATDDSSKNLFGAIKEKAKDCLGSEDKWIQYIGENRIFIYNIWPWFRCGQYSSGKNGIHSDFSKVPCLEHWLATLINHLNPRKIATLGGWAFNDDASKLEADIRSKRPSWFIENFLKSTTFARYSADNPEVRQFYHPGNNHFWNGNPKWFAATPEYLPPILPSLPRNNEAFKDFLDYSLVSPPDVLNGHVDE